jgi:TPP-dependent pyruvate/acetoin dehydrogenase alpha subunit
MDAAILQEVEQAVVFAQESPFPPLEAASEDVFAD